MTLHKLGEPDPEPEPVEPERFKVDFSMTDEEWESKFGHWRYQCDWCQTSYPLKEWTGFGLAVSDFTSLSSMEINAWRKLIDGDAHFCDARCAGQYLLESIGGYEVKLSFGPS